MATARTSIELTVDAVPSGQRCITFFVPEAEAQELVAAAELSGRSLGSYIRSRVLGPPAAMAEAHPTPQAIALVRLQADLEKTRADIHELLRWVKFGHSPLAEEFRAALAQYRNTATAIRLALRRKPGSKRR